MTVRTKIYNRILSFFLLSWTILFLNCSMDEEYVHIAYSPVNYNLQAMPYENLSAYNFFQGEIKNLNPVYGVLPYDLINPLFTDYAEKNRFLWMPQDQSAYYITDSDVFNFPTGTILIKNFAYNNVAPSNERKNIETRLMIKKDEGWIFANYIWNDDQTEATFSLDGASVDIELIENAVTNLVKYRIPSGSECITCHKIYDTSIPNGVKPKNINKTLDYGDQSINQIQKWIDYGYLESARDNIEAMVDWTDPSNSLELRVRSYIDINCAHCHSDDTHCEYRPIRLDFDSTEDLTNLGVCLPPDTDLGNGADLIVSPGNFVRSALHFRMATIEEEYRMPLLGRSLVHQEALDLVEDWIMSLEIDCN